MKFLIDECLSPKLTELAHEKGYGQSSHIVRRPSPEGYGTAGARP